ncbi:MAG: hypothetical protein QXO96_03810 [Sulfolobales archaeon]
MEDLDFRVIGVGKMFGEGLKYIVAPFNLWNYDPDVLEHYISF